MKYLIIDAHNLLMRSRHVTKGDIFLQSSMSLHIIFNSIRSAWNKFDADHVVFCFEGRSWRKDYYERYKANRTSVKLARNQDEIEEDKVFYDMANKFFEYINEKTNCTVLQHDKVEADDFIARWIQRHNETIVDKANNKFIIVSSDTDFHQLIDTNVEIFDGISQKIYRHDGIFKENGQRFKDKNGKDLEKIEPEWALFQKCVRGDTSDNILSAYPGARVKGSKKTVGIREAFEDRFDKGWAWNNFMLQRWTDHNDVEHVVKDRYEENEILIDLSKQPQEIKDILDNVIDEVQKTSKKVPMVGIQFLKFCGMFDLQKIGQSPNSYIEFLNSPLKIS